MRIYKEKQFLIFDFEDGKTVKYDFKTQTCIGKRGKPVNDLRTQLGNMSFNELYGCFEDEKYAKFLNFIKEDRCRFTGIEMQNIGSILKCVPKYKNFEQIFSAGIENVESSFNVPINEIPRGVIKILKTHDICLDRYLVKIYNENPNGFNIAFALDYVSLNDKDVEDVLRAFYYNNGIQCIFNTLIGVYGYKAKNLMLYLDRLKTYEAIENMRIITSELYDYAKMMSNISNKFDRYPRHFLTTHRIASRNYNRLKTYFDEEAFKKQIDTSMEKTFGYYCFIYPKSTQEIKDEAVSQHNCVASYVSDVINGVCHILFLRRKDKPNESLVTIEVRNNKIVQAKKRFNDDVTKEEQVAIDRWNLWQANKQKKNESEELKYVG